MFVAPHPPPLSTGSENVAIHQESLCLEARKRAHLEDAYCTFLIKCQFSNEIPTAIHFARCIDFLRREIELLKPQVIITIGSEVQLDDQGKVHTLNFPDLIKEFVSPDVAVTWVYNPENVFVNRKSKPGLIDEFYKQHAAIPALIH
jgi:uracil-DNA glycosylase family 4